MTTGDALLTSGDDVVAFARSGLVLSRVRRRARRRRLLRRPGDLRDGGGGAVLGAGGSLIGNVMDDERGEGTLRLGMEALNAASLAAVPGFAAQS